MPKALMKFHHGSKRQLVAINIAAWAAGAYFLLRSCGPMEEERMGRTPAPMTPSAEASAPTGTTACGKHDCVFRLK